MGVFVHLLFFLSFQVLYSSATPGWAVLVAGSQKWIRYRHQSNVCNMYQILRAQGFPKEKIITFMFDDIATHPNNPTPNVIINEPNGTNVYHDVEIDYKGTEVNKENLFKVLLGDSSTGKKVIKGGKTQNIFLYYTGLADESGEFTMSHPTEGYIKNTEFIEVIKKMYNLNQYYRLFIAFEASHSGMMFEGILPNNLKAIVLTAGATDEDTHGAFCNVENYHTCLAGLFSYHFSYFLKQADLSKRTIFDAFEYVRQATKVHHAQLYGQLPAGNMKLKAFLYSRPRSEMGQARRIENVVHEPELWTDSDLSVDLTNIDSIDY